VRDAAAGLRYRDFLTVALVVDGEDLFPDNWIYIHEPRVRVGRIQNHRSWSPWMVPDAGKACVGLEYFCFSGDELWDSTDEELVALATRELETLGLAPAHAVERGYVTRVPLAYPMYDASYTARVGHLRTWLNGVANLQQVGRKRAAPLQQLRPLDAHGDARGRQRPARHPSRPVGGQRRIRVPRGARPRGAALPSPPGEHRPPGIA
jgi:protoporphyrinogen oxidase